MDEVCTYKKFRTGLTFKDVRRMLWVNSEDRNDWKQVSRHTVLGLWKQIKEQMYFEYLKQNEHPQRVSFEEPPF